MQQLPAPANPFERRPKAIETTAAEKADRSRRDAERRRDVLVRTGGRFEEQHLDHALAAIRQPGDGITQCL
jgi:hypothetical protein